MTISRREFIGAVGAVSAIGVSSMQAQTAAADLVLYNGKIVKSGHKELAYELEIKGYDWIKKELGEFTNG